MTKYREILRLKSLGFSDRNIAPSGFIIGLTGSQRTWLICRCSEKIHQAFCSQFRESEWYQQICGGESTLADVIMDRISYDSYKIDIKSIDPTKDLSMRKVYGLDPAQSKQQKQLTIKRLRRQTATHLPF